MPRSTGQPAAVVSDDDVERLVRRDFTPAQVDETLALLRTYGTQTWEPEVPRVRAAILRLAAGDMDRLRQQLDYAKRDYRDVLLGAEYMVYATLTLRTPNPSPGEAQHAITADWSAYQAWLRR